MSFKSKRRWQIVLQYSIGWTLAFIFLGIVRGEGTRELGSVQFEFWDTVVACLILGPIFGSISGIAQVLTEEYGYKRISLNKLLGLRLLFAILFVAAIVLFAYSIYGEDIGLYEFAFEPGSFAIYFYIVSVDFFLFNLRQLSLFLGGKNLWKLLRGKYYSPKEEERIFMFLDLQSSTSHAERLGHIEYSKMIRDCFNDLGVVIENEAEIYQYVGDEVVLTWKVEEGLRNLNCIKAFYNFKEQLIKKQEYYIENYNCKPFFKAGLNVGIVTVTEIGKYKKEIAYHGDPINTAARIQGKCNELKKELLISGSLMKMLDDSEYSFEYMDIMKLKGKDEKVSLFAVTKMN